MEGRPWKKGSESQCGDPMTQTPELRTPGCMCWGTVPISATLHLYSLYLTAVSCSSLSAEHRSSMNSLARSTPSFKGRRDAVLSGGSTKIFLTFD